MALSDRRARVRSSGDRRRVPRYVKDAARGRFDTALTALIMAGMATVAILCVLILAAPAHAYHEDGHAFDSTGGPPQSIAYHLNNGAERYPDCGADGNVTDYEVTFRATAGNGKVRRYIARQYRVRGGYIFRYRGARGGLVEVRLRIERDGFTIARNTGNVRAILTIYCEGV